MGKKRGQEEIVGFVLIVVIIAVIFVIFLGIKLRNPEPVQRESEILYQFLESSMEQTTDCVLNQGGANEILNELIKECYSVDNTCLSGRTACETVEETLDIMLNSTWRIGLNYPYKGYEVNIDYGANSTSEEGEEILSFANGNCTSGFIGNSYWIPQFPGRIIVDAKLCS